MNFICIASIKEFRFIMFIPPFSISKHIVYLFTNGCLPSHKKFHNILSISFIMCYNTNLLPPTPISSFRHLKQGIQEFHRKYVLVPADNSTSRYIDDLLNIDNPYFEGQIYPPELQLNKANISDTEAPFLDLHLSVSNGFVSSKIYDKRDYFDFDIVNFPFFDVDVARRSSYGEYISQLIRFARVCNHVTDFNARINV